MRTVSREFLRDARDLRSLIRLASTPGGTRWGVGAWTTATVEEKEEEEEATAVLTRVAQPRLLLSDEKIVSVVHTPWEM